MLENEGYNRKICVLGVAGGSASGKTTIINRVKDYFGNDIAVISHDNYYKAHDDMPFEERCKLNYDHPDSFESERMAEDVRKLLKGYPIEMPTYDYVNHNRAKETHNSRTQAGYYHGRNSYSGEQRA